MRRNDRAERALVESGWSVGLVTAIRDLVAAGWTVQQIAAQVPVLQKHAGNEAIRAAGLNGGPPAENLLKHMETYGGILAFRMRELQADDISAN